MCTVTYIPSEDGVFLTSNRDEKSWRQQAIPPKVYAYETGSIVFPKDRHAGGTWIAAHENGHAIVFLNGAFEAHSSTPPYKKSRGIVLLDLLNSQSPYNSFQSSNLTNIEPFTAIILDQGILFECRWDGAVKHHETLKTDQPYIWSSATLYDRSIREKRSNWFNQWLERTPNITLADILQFHQFTGDGDRHNDLLMNRDGKVGTVSISCIELADQKMFMHYLDLQTNERFTHELGLKTIMADY
ncbi:MAG TPA: NRDE family protein [Flavitalea sp.]|nr:NRDE family protein [Flavitalea sp.]